MAGTVPYGVDDTIQIEPEWNSASGGKILKTIDVQGGQFWQLDALTIQMVTPDDPAKVVFHIYVKVNGVGKTPFWRYGTKDTALDAYQPENYFPHWRMWGPATITVLAINDTGVKQNLFWASSWRVEP